MNHSIIIYMLGWIMNIEAALMLIPILTAVVYKEGIISCYAGVAVVCAVLGFLCTRKKPKVRMFFAREGFVLVSLGWLVLSFFGCLPFVLSGEIPHFIDALFEIVSGFTTTGSSILPEVEKLSKASLIWRSFSHWIGGMGVLVFILAILPMAGDYDMHIMRAESPGPSVGKLVPKIRITAKLLYVIYFFITVVTAVFLLIGKMPIFDTICMSLGAAGTGGFACRNSGQAGYTVYQQAVLSIAMILFGINFNVYYLLLIRKPKEAFKCEEMRGYLAIILAAVVLITINIRSMFPSLFLAAHHALFQVASIITTTGYSTVDFDKWPEFSRTLLVFLMFVGACAGSTGGGIKVSRILMYMKTIKKELAILIHPRSVKVVLIDGKKLDHPVVRAANIFLISYAGILALSILLLSIDNFDFTTNVTAVISALNNIGPGLSLVGPSGNFAFFSGFSKYVLMFDMLAGRLEIFPMLLLFVPYTWKK